MLRIIELSGSGCRSAGDQLLMRKLSENSLSDFTNMQKVVDLFVERRETISGLFTRVNVGLDDSFGSILMYYRLV